MLDEYTDWLTLPVYSGHSALQKAILSQSDVENGDE
jgi:hypothetical protein